MFVTPNLFWMKTDFIPSLDLSITLHRSVNFERKITNIAVRFTLVAIEKNKLILLSVIKLMERYFLN